MDRTKMALGMVVGAVLLHLGFVACDGSGRMRGHGLLGGGSAFAQDAATTDPPVTGACARWDVQYFNVLNSATGDTTLHLPAGWDPFAPIGYGYAATPYNHYTIGVLARRCAEAAP